MDTPFTSMRRTKSGATIHVCPTCGQKRYAKSRRKPVLVVKSLDKHWGVLVYPLRYSIVRLMPGQERPTWFEVQRIPRTRNTYRDDQFDAAISAMHRRMRQHKKEIAKQFAVLKVTR